MGLITGIVSAPDVGTDIDTVRITHTEIKFPRVQPENEPIEPLPIEWSV
jgi:hypothetical protein